MLKFGHGRFRETVMESHVSSLGIVLMVPLQPLKIFVRNDDVWIPVIKAVLCIYH